jgi:hypothetical protein
MYRTYKTDIATYFWVFSFAYLLLYYIRKLNSLICYPAFYLHVSFPA